MAACSYLEVLVGRLVRLAILSRPGILLGDAKLVEGVRVLKFGTEIVTGPHEQTVTKGRWPARLAAYKKLFTNAPPELVDNIGELDEMRKVRNSVGHTFGRGGEIHEVDDRRMQRLAEPRLKKWLGIVDQVGLALDRDLGHRFIGEFEILLEYHRLRPQGTNEQRAQALRKRLFELFRTRAGKVWSQRDIAFYDGQ
jgi:hypothetical protein